MGFGDEEIIGSLHGTGTSITALATKSIDHYSERCSLALAGIP